jgi:hypothetical protein
MTQTESRDEAKRRANRERQHRYRVISASVSLLGRGADGFFQGATVDRQGWVFSAGRRFKSFFWQEIER